MKYTKVAPETLPVGLEEFRDFVNTVMSSLQRIENKLDKMNNIMCSRQDKMLTGFQMFCAEIKDSRRRFVINPYI